MSTANKENTCEDFNTWLDHRNCQMIPIIPWSQTWHSLSYTKTEAGHIWALVCFRCAFKNLCFQCEPLRLPHATFCISNFSITSAENFGRTMNWSSNEEKANGTRTVTLPCPSHIKELWTCCQTQHFIRRGFTHAFWIRIIFHTHLSSLTSAAG